MTEPEADPLLRENEELRRRLEEAEETLHALRSGEAEREEAQRQALQAERLAAVSQAAEGLAHETRNALQRSQACLSVLALRCEGRPEDLDLLARLQRAQDDLHRLYEGVRDYAAPLRLDRRPCRLAEVWREAWRDLAPLAEEKKAELREEAGGDWECLADRGQMKRVFLRLLHNALESGGDPPRAEIRCGAAELGGRGAVRVAVRDNGPGFAPEQRGRLFEPFYTTKVRGAGLGLALCRRVVEAHGGRIEAGAGAGAEVVLTLPRRDA
jgi:signal transduction histidine kinase